jgi:c-di-GMP-binding flagellar brake protein YcgR
VEERRKFVRVKGLSDVNFKVKGSIQKKRRVEVKDISFIGINLYADVKMPDGTLVELELDIPGASKTIMIEGKTIWQLSGRNDRFATGIRFNHTDEQDEKILSKFIHDCASRVDETREFIRCHMEEDLSCSYLESPDEKFSAQSIDISRGGMKVISAQQFKSGDRMSISFKLPGAVDIIEIQTKIVWVKPCEDKAEFEAGIIFTRLKEEDKQSIWKFIEKYCRTHKNS